MTPRTCSTCQSARVNELSFPCRFCDDQSHWQLAKQPPWPAFPVAVRAWEAARDELEVESVATQQVAKS
jgi:hypothetical protein